MGKSTASAAFRCLGVAVYDSDAAVHALMHPSGAAFAAIRKAFPHVGSDTGIDRKLLGDIAFTNKEVLSRLESILHPLVRESKKAFLKGSARRRRRMVVLDVPLLYETSGQNYCDAVAVVTAPFFVQRARVMSRPGMTHEKFENILVKQVPDLLKRQYADFIIQTGIGRYESFRTIRHIVNVTKTLKSYKWPQH